MEIVGAASVAGFGAAGGRGYAISGVVTFATGRISRTSRRGDEYIGRREGDGDLG